LIQEIQDFKTWVLGCLDDGLKTLVGHINMHLFRSFVDLSGWPMMQYKVSPTNSVWSLMDGLLTKLWKVNLDGSLKLPIGIPSLVPYRII